MIKRQAVFARKKPLKLLAGQIYAPAKSINKIGFDIFVFGEKL
jgi:hypothetical protein